MITTSGKFKLLRDETQAVIAQMRTIQQDAETDFEAAQAMMQHLGAHLDADGKAVFGLSLIHI